MTQEEGWRLNLRILQDLEKIQKSLALLARTEEVDRGKLQKIVDVVVALNDVVTTLARNQVECCTSLNDKLDKLITYLIPPPPKDPAGFTAFLSE